MIIMKKEKRLSISAPDDFDILSALWILACNHETPIMTYEGVRNRLNLHPDYDLRKLVLSRGELFRKAVSNKRLKTWKAEMIEGKHLPSWIVDEEDETIKKRKIDSITMDDVFRSQFRTEDNAPRSPVEVMDWGLQHIDRLRKANLESRDEKIKNWQLWSVLAISIVNTIITITLALTR
jgi:hypothetical protein